jgi:hypothetical protein
MRAQKILHPHATAKILLLRKILGGFLVCEK